MLTQSLAPNFLAPAAHPTEAPPPIAQDVGSTSAAVTRDAFVQSQEQAVAVLDGRIRETFEGIQRAEARTRELEGEIAGYRSFDTALAWTFPGALAAGVGLGLLLHNPALVVGGLALSAGSYMVRTFSSGTPVKLYGEVGEVRQEIGRLAEESARVTQDKDDTRRRAEEMLKMLDAATGEMAGRLGIHEEEETVDIGGIKIKKRTQVL